MWVNNYRATSFTSPFGGYKESGIGRESGIETIKEYLHTKCVWISSDLEVPESVHPSLIRAGPTIEEELADEQTRWTASASST